MRPLVVLSHTYVEPENRGKLRALAAGGPVTAVVPRHWRESALGRTWHVAAGEDGGVNILPTRWLGPARPSLGVMRLPRSLPQAGALLQIEEETWTPTAYLAARSWRGAAAMLFTWENVPRRLPPPWSFMRQSVLRSVHGIIAGNQDAAGLVRAAGFAGPVAVIPQLGIKPPAPAHQPRLAGPLRVAFVGRLVREKGVDVLLRAAAKLAGEWRLQVVGGGSERPALERLAAQLGLSARVSFAGPVPHDAVAQVWPETHVLVLPSRSTPTWREQLGHVLLEAMAHGVAVVGSTCGAIPEVMGEAGLCFPEGDAAALTAAIQRFLDDPTLVARLGEAGRRRVETEFTNRILAARTREFHELVLSEQTRSRVLSSGGP